MQLANIQNALTGERIYITDHAKEEADNDHLKLHQVIESVYGGEIIEDYPLDRPYPSCLIYGRTREDLPVHSVWAYNADTSYAVLITVYIPDPKRWVNYRERIRK